MYAEYKNISNPRRENFPFLWVWGENSLYISTWIVAGWLLWPVQWHHWPIATILWGLIVLTVQLLLKKHNCSGCYYYGKSCHLGWGGWSAFLFKQDSGNIKTGMRLSLFYILSPPAILLAGTLAGFFLKTGMLHWFLLGLFVMLNAAAFPVRTKSCSVCAMRAMCPGSACKH